MRSTLALLLLGGPAACTTMTLPEERRDQDALPATAESGSPETAWAIELARAVGTVSHATHGNGANGLGRGTTDGARWLGRVERFGASGFGGGVAAEAGGSDDDLLSDAGFTGGQEEFHEVFAYLGGRVQLAEWFEVVLRTGPYFHRTSIETQPGGDGRAWRGAGFRVEASPVWWLERGDPIALGLYADAAAGLHVTRIHDSIAAATDETYDGRGKTLGLGAGITALAADHVEARVGYLYRLASETENNDDFLFGPVDTVVPAASTKFRGIVVELSLRF